MNFVFNLLLSVISVCALFWFGITHQQYWPLLAFAVGIVAVLLFFDVMYTNIKRKD